MTRHIDTSARYPWRRLWIAPDDLGGVAVRGLFSADLHAMSRASSPVPVRSMQAMVDVRVLLLRGESGAGKSVAFAQEAERLEAAGARAVLADLADGVCDLPALLAKRGGERGLTILVDGLDVGLIRDKTLMPAIRRAIPKLAGRAGARLRFSLRSGFAAGPLVESFQTHFGDEFEHLTLAPLRAEDVKAAAFVEGQNPDAFFRVLEAWQLTPLAARPPTLRMLLRLWARHGSLPNRRDHLYAEGCEVLVQEANRHRLDEDGGDNPAFVGDLPASDRLAIAERIAALMTFGGHDHLDLGAETGEGLSVEAIIGGVEPGAGGVKLTRRAVREVVETALFRPFGGSGFAFAHPSLMRFLAARFLISRGVTPVQGLPLLTASDDRIGANRIEVASWLGALDVSYFQCLATADPQVLLRAGIPAASMEQRLLLARALLQVSAGGSLDFDELAATGDLVLVRAPGLETLLAEVLGDKSQPLARRRFAAQLAEVTGCVPIDVCAAITAEDAEPDALRHDALDALAESPTAARGPILALCDGPDPLLRAAALSIAMEGLLSPAEVISRYEPGSRGIAQMSFVIKLFRYITPGNLPAALEAIVEVATHEDAGLDYDGHMTLTQGLAQRALGFIDQPAVFEALSTFIAALPPTEPWLRWSFPLQKRGLPLAVTVERRRALVTSVVERALDNAVAATNLLEACFVLHNEDLAWVAMTARDALGGPREQLWATLAVEVAQGCGGPAYNYLVRQGLTPNEAHRIGAASFAMARDFERWTAPAWWSPTTGSPRTEDEVEDDAVTVETDQEPLGKALDDWKLLTVQKEAGGRANAPALEPATLLALIDRADRRLVLDDSDLLRVVRESLDRLERRLKGKGPLVRGLWNEGAICKPKDENFLSDFVVDHFEHDLKEAGVIANREVEIRPRLRETRGERTDIWVQVFTKPKSPGGPRRIASLTIEVKGCWNDELYSAMQAQLLGRYMQTTGETVGLYLVGWYLCSAWSEPKIAGLVPATVGATIDELRAQLEVQAESLSGQAHIKAYVLDTTLN